MYWLLGFGYATLKEVRNSYLTEEAEQTKDTPPPPSPLAIAPLTTGSKRKSATNHGPTPDAPKEKKPTYETQMINRIDLTIEQKKLGEQECKQLI